MERFRAARDLRRVLEIERDAFDADAWPADLFRAYGEHPAAQFLVARVGRAIAGYAIMTHQRSGAEIESLAVHSRYRRRGVASALFQAVLRRARRAGASSIGLMVRRDNEGAIRFYRALGFARTATVARYYEDGATGWRMRLQIP